MMEILTFKEACLFLRIGKNDLYGLVNSEAIPHIRINKGGKIRFRKDSLIRWLERKEIPEPASVKIEKIKLIRR